MSEEKKKAGRPTKVVPEDLEWEDFKLRLVHDYEILRCYSRSYRLRIAARAMKIYLHSRGTKGEAVAHACTNEEVMIPFLLSRLYGQDVRAWLRKCLGNEEWENEAAWEILCTRWNEKLAKSREVGGNMASVWRLALMVEGWRLLDEYYCLDAARSGSSIFPSKSEVMVAAKSWLLNRGVVLPENPNIIGKGYLRFREIGLDWIEREGLGLDQTPPPSFVAGKEPCVELHCSRAKLKELERQIREYDSEGAAVRELEYLAGLDWSDESEMP